MRRALEATLLPADFDVVAFRNDLLHFFDRAARDLPWRGTGDPFHIWVSEIMLQQTRVDTVVPYFERWMKRFPDLTTLADTELDEVLPLWEGLGYYSRARNLHRAAQIVRDEFDGRVPDDAAGLRALPGIGAYTAGAVASIAFGRKEAVVDGNVRRVFSRIADVESPVEKALWATADVVLDPERPGDHNQALMELGATICTPRDPECDRCPVQRHCLAWARDTVAQRPAPKKRRSPKSVHFVSLVLLTPGGRTLLARRPDAGLLARLWEFPTLEVDGPPGVDDGRDPAIESGTAIGHAAAIGFDTAIERFEPVPHVFTHLRAQYHPLVLRSRDEPHDADEAVHTLTAIAAEAGVPGAERVAPSALRLVDAREATGVALPVAQQKILARLRVRVDERSDEGSA